MKKITLLMGMTMSAFLFLTACGQNTTPVPAAAPSSQPAAAPVHQTPEPAAKKTMEQIVKDAGFTDAETAEISGLLKEIGLKEILSVRKERTQTDNDTLDSAVVMRVGYQQNGKNTHLEMKIRERKVQFISTSPIDSSLEFTYYRQADGGMIGTFGGAGLSETERELFYTKAKSAISDKLGNPAYTDFKSKFEEDKSRFTYTVYNDIVTAAPSLKAGKDRAYAKEYRFTVQFSKSTGELIKLRLWE